MPRVSKDLANDVVKVECRHDGCSGRPGHRCRFVTSCTFHQVRINDAVAIRVKTKKLEEWEALYGGKP